MKTGSFTPVAGEKFNWHYDSNDSHASGETIWIAERNEYVTCNSENVLVSLTDTEMRWRNSYHNCEIVAKISELAPASAGRAGLGVHPRWSK